MVAKFVTHLSWYIIVKMARVGRVPKFGTKWWLYEVDTIPIDPLEPWMRLENQE